MKTLLALILILSCVTPLYSWADDSASETVKTKEAQEEVGLPPDPSEDPNLIFDDEASLGGGPADSNRFFQHILQFSERYPSAHSR